jgi:hypothetical protein
MTVRIACLATAFLLTACAGSAQITRGEKYASPMGQFTCGPFKLETRIQSSFGPHGGTVRFIDEVGMTRVDVAELQPSLDARALEQSRENVYQGYLSDEVLPLVKSAVPGARLLDSRSAVIGAHSVYQSAILMPGSSGAISGDGKRLDGLRGQVQYTDGRYMFTVSINSVVWSDRSIDENITNALSYAGSMFKTCSFP